MKISKSELKSIVKECLIEVLNEGLGGVGVVQRQALPMQRQIVPSNLSDNIKRKTVQETKAKLPFSSVPQINEAIKREAGGNKVMEDILADTAASTLPKFLQAGEGKSPVQSTAGGGLVEQVVAQANPEDLFGDDVASKWADLAFMNSPTKK